MIKANRGRILVKMIPRYEREPNKLNLTLVDGKKHYHGVRWGVVESIGIGVREVRVGDEVMFRGDAGFTLDGDPEVENEIYGRASENGTVYRWLKEEDCLAVQEPEGVTA